MVVSCSGGTYCKWSGQARGMYIARFVQGSPAIHSLLFTGLARSGMNGRSGVFPAGDDKDF